MTTIYFIRHGESLGNLEKRFLGHTDLDITPLGYKQAELAARFFKDIHIDKIYASDLKRAYNTAAAISSVSGIEIEKRSALREIYAGKWENMRFDDIQKTYSEAYGVWRGDIGNAICTEGESTCQLQSRIYGEVLNIAEQNEDKTVVIATHATPIRALMCKWRGFPLSKMSTVPWVSNASITMAEYEDGIFTLKIEGYDGHLGEIKTDLPPNV